MIEGVEMKLTSPTHTYTKGCRAWLVFTTVFYFFLAVGVSGFFYKFMLLLLAATHLLMVLKPKLSFNPAGNHFWTCRDGQRELVCYTADSGIVIRSGIYIFDYSSDPMLVGQKENENKFR